MADLPQCSNNPSNTISEAINALGCEWAKYIDRPYVDVTIKERWDELLVEWCDNERLPLLIRKSSGIRGSVVEHRTGRSIVITDNSPAQWACRLALNKEVPDIDGIDCLINDDRLPVSFAHKKAEASQRKYHCTLGKHNVNQAGWKLCHIQGVGLNSPARLKDIDSETLKAKFKLLLSPSNYFLIPKRWGGMGEVSEFIEGYQNTCAGKI